ncbi:MAG TPA: hypothetical protein VIN10_08220 [Bacteroidales bacterium]
MKVIYLTFACLFFLSLSAYKVQDKQEEEKTYVKFSVSGNQINNTFDISGDQDNSSQNVTAMIFPDGTSGENKLVELSYMDGAQNMSVYLKTPAKSGLVEIKEANPKYSFSISIGDINLKAQSVSVNTEDVIIDKMMQMTASYVKGSFEGVFIYEYTKGSEEIKEPYLISGNFQFMSPRYKPKN